METTSDAVVLWNKFLKYCEISSTEMTDTELTRRLICQSLSEEEEETSENIQTIEAKCRLRQRRGVAVRQTEVKGHAGLTPVFSCLHLLRYSLP